MARQLLVESIRIDGQTQSRERINEEAVAEYAEAMKAPAAASWPPVTVFFDGKEYWLTDGFHRLLAAQRIGRKNIMADVKQGSRADAAWASCAANQTHGLRRTNADKRYAAEMALRLHPEMSDRAIAAHCGFSDPFVGQVRRQVLTVSTSRFRAGTDGKRYPLPAPRAEAAAQAPEQSEHGAGLGPPPRSDERPGFTAADSQGQVPQQSGTHAAGQARPVDDLGRRIPDHLLELWGRRQEVQDLLTGISRARVAIEAAQKSKDPLFSEVPYSSALAHLDQAYNAVQVAKPYAVCAFCQGHGCKACGQRGLLGKFRWDTAVPKEHKEAVARLIAKERGA